MRSIVMVVPTLIVLTSGVRAGDAPDPNDFYVMLKTCKLVAASSASMENGIGVITAKPPSWACSNAGRRKVSCIQDLNDGSANSRHELTIEVDAADTLILHDEMWTYWFWIDRSSRVANVTTRIVGDPVAKTGARAIGAQLCQGIFLTGDEAKQLEKSYKAGPNQKK